MYEKFPIKHENGVCLYFLFFTIFKVKFKTSTWLDRIIFVFIEYAL